MGTTATKIFNLLDEITNLLEPLENLGLKMAFMTFFVVDFLWLSQIFM